MSLRKRVALLASIALLTGLCAYSHSAVPGEKQSEKPSEEVDIKKVSEAFGHFIGRNLKTSGLGFESDSFIQGIKDGMAGKPAPMSDKDYEQQMSLLQEQAFKRLSEDNLSGAEAFLKKNASEKGVIEIEPGKLQYQVVKEGQGAVVKDNNSPQVNYTGKYLDGTVFGSSQDTGGPITIPLDQTIPGFSKGLKGMKEGEVRKIFVHPDLGYGKSGHLPPNSLLIFEVELIKADSPQNKESGAPQEPFADNDSEQAAKAKAPQSSEGDDEDDEDNDDEDDEDEIIIEETLIEEDSPSKSASKK